MYQFTYPSLTSLTLTMMVYQSFALLFSDRDDRWLIGCMCVAIVANLVQGLTPNASIHNSFMDVEPITGLAMRAYKRLQINAKLQHIPTIAGVYSRP
jgi:hypothetical protein